MRIVSDMSVQIVLDTETTGLRPEDGHRLIEIGGIKLIDRVMTAERFHSYLNPQCAVDKAASKVHGLTDNFLCHQPIFSDICDSFLSFIQSADALIIHNAAFDLGFLDAELRRLGRRPGKIIHYCQVIDSLALARKKHPGQRNSLDALCKRYHVDSTKRQFHGALLDAHLLAQVYLLMTGGQESFLLDDQEISSEASSSGLSNDNLSTSLGSRGLVIEADFKEREAHEAFMLKLRTLSNKDMRNG